MSRGIWKKVETEAVKTGMAKTKGRRVKEAKTERIEEGRKKKKKKPKKEKIIEVKKIAKEWEI